MKIYRSFSSEETKGLGKKIAQKIARGRKRKAAKSGLVFALTGELGSGKTTFVRGFLLGLGLKSGGASPTFILMRRHALRNKKFKNVYHVDAYRLKKARDLSLLGFKEILADPENILLVEWAEKIKRILPPDAVRLEFLHGKKENERTIFVKRRENGK